MILSSLPLAQAGGVRALGVTSRTRSPIAPDAPILGEAGLPGFEAHLWYGVWVGASPAAFRGPHCRRDGTLRQAVEDARLTFE